MKKLSGYFLGLSLIILLLSSFKPGGDSYEIYLGKERLAEHFVHFSKSTPAIKLTSQNAKEQLSIFYNHCGKLGNARMITIRSKDSKIEKTWKFPDAHLSANLIGGAKFMKIDVNEIIELKKKAGKNQLRIYYTSKELSQGMMLATIE